MQPKRKQGPSSRAAQPPQARKPQGPFFKTGDYVPLAIIIVKDGRPHNHHLPQKLFALKDFKQADALLAYHFQHPQQPAMLDPRHPDVNAFNSAVVNMHKWMIANGYCRQEGTSDLKVHVWTEEEMAVARAEEAELRKQITEGNLSPEALATLKAAGLDLTDIQLQPAEDRTQVNVGTVGHVDHGTAGETISLEEMEAKFTDADPEQVAARADRGDTPNDVKANTDAFAGRLAGEEGDDKFFAAPDEVGAAVDEAIAAGRVVDSREDVLNDDVRKSYPEPAISAAELLAADPKGGL